MTTVVIVLLIMALISAVVVLAAVALGGRARDFEENDWYGEFDRSMPDDSDDS
jgi:hypothetical protein